MGGLKGELRVRGVVALDVHEGHPPQERRQVVIAAGPQRQVPVVAHQAVAAQPHREPPDPVGQDRLKGQEVRRLAEDAQTPVGSIEHVVHRSTQRNPPGS